MEISESDYRALLAAKVGAETELVRLRTLLTQAQQMIGQLELEKRSIEAAQLDTYNKNVTLTGRIRELENVLAQRAEPTSVRDGLAQVQPVRPDGEREGIGQVLRQHVDTPRSG